MSKMMDKLLNKKPKKEYKAEILDKPEPLPVTEEISAVKVNETDNPEKQERGSVPEPAQDVQGTPSVQLSGHYDELAQYQVKVLEAIYEQLQLTNQILTKQYELFAEQAKQ